MRINFFKKVTALTLATVLALSAVPSMRSISVFADSTNRISNNVSVSRRTIFYEPGIDAPKLSGTSGKVKYVASGSYLNIRPDETIESGSKFNLTLVNAKFAFQNWDTYLKTTPIDTDKGSINGDVDTKTDEYELTVIDDDYASVKLLKDFAKDEVIKVPMIVRMDEDLESGSAKVKIEANNTGISGNSSGITFASINKGATKTTVKNVQTGKNKILIKELLITENVAGSMNPDENEGFYLELPSGYYFSRESGFKVDASVNVSGTSSVELKNGSRRLEVTFSDFTPATSSPGRIKITGLAIIPRNDADNITKEDIMIDIGNIGSGEMVTEETFKAGVIADYGVGFNTSGTVPTILNGFYDSSSASNEKVKSVKVVVSEDTANSLINGGDLTLKISDRAKIRAVKIEDAENLKSINGTVELGKAEHGVEVKESKVILRGLERSDSDSSSKAKFTITFYLSVESGYEGDISLTISGDALRKSSSSSDDEQTFVIAKAVNPISVNVQTNNFKPGTTVELEDIVLTENKVSNGKKNYSAFEEDKTFVFGFKNNNNYLSIVGTPTVKVENGSVKDVRVNNSSRNGSNLSFKIKETSSGSNISKITISGLKVSSSASTPQGSYDLVVGGTAIAGNSTALIGTDSSKAASFSTDGITVAKLQYGGAIAMKVTIGDRLAVINGKNVEMKVAPFIDPATGTTYMQVSDIVKATGMNCSFFDNRIHKLNGMNINLFVTFGSRTFEQNTSSVRIYGETIPETMTNEQGLPVNMIIKDEYSCLPLRYFVEKVLGQKISWNGTDNTIVIE